MRLNLVVLKTPTPDMLAKFYTLFGAMFEHHSHGNGPLHYAAELGDVVLEIYPLTQGNQKADNTLRLGFTVDDLDDITQHVRDFGGKIVKEPAASEWGYVSIVEDLDGRKIELKQKVI